MSSGDLLSSLTFGAPQGPVGYCVVQDPVESWIHQGLIGPCGHYRPCGALWIFHGPSLSFLSVTHFVAQGTHRAIGSMKYP